MPIRRDPSTGRLVHDNQGHPQPPRWVGSLAMGGPGGAAPADATYVVLSANGSLTAERVLTPIVGQLVGTDNGPNSTYTLGLATTAVTPGAYGDATNVARFTVDGFGRLTAAANVPIAGVPASPHDLLSATHPDTVASTPPSPGDVLYGNPANLWDRFPLDGSNAENILGVAITLDNLEWKRLTTNHADTASWAAGPGAVQLVFGDVLTQLTDFGSALGIVVKSSVLTTDFRTLQEPAAGLAIVNPAGLAGDPEFVLMNDLAALEGLAGTGYARRTGVDTWTLDSTATPAAHMLLGVVHSDTTFAVPVRGDIVIANPTPTWDRLGIGTAGQILKVVGTSPNLDPDWVSGVPLVRVNDTNVTVTLTGSPTTALVTTTTMTLGWSGQLSIARGGTGAATALAAFNALSPLTTRGDLLTRDATDNIRLAIGTTGKYLRTDGTDPSWQALAYADLTGVPTAFPITVRKNTGADVGTRSRLNFIEGANITLTIADDGGSGEVDITIASSGGVTAHDLLSATHSDTLTAAVSRGSLIVGNATPLWSELVIGAAATFLKSDGTDAAWTAIAAADITAGTALVRVDDTNVTMALTGSPTVALLATTTMTLGWTGQLSIARGGTGQATALAAFNALSPLTTRGDLLTRDATNNVRLGVGSAATYLRSDGTDPSWQTIAYADISGTPTSLPPSGAAGGDLTGTYPNPTLAAVITAGGPTGSATVVPVITWDAKGRLTAVTTATIVGPFPPSGSAGGDLTGTYPNPTVADADLIAIRDLAATAGFLSRTGAGAFAARTFLAGTGLTISNPTGAAGDPTFALNLAAIDHNSLLNLAVGDVHTQYLLLAGRTGATNNPKISTSASGTITGSSASGRGLVLVANDANADTTRITIDGSTGVTTVETTIVSILAPGTVATAPELRLFEPAGSGTNYSAFKAQAQAANLTYTLPAALTTDGFLKTGATGTLTWATLTDADIPDTITLSNLTQITTRLHSSLQSLTVDDHTQYLLLAGRTGTTNDPVLSTDADGTITGSAASGFDLYARSTSHATKGLLRWNDSQLWWEDVPDFTSAATLTQYFARITAAISSTVTGTEVHTLIGLGIEPVLTQDGPINTGQTKLIGVEFSPTATMTTNLVANAMHAGGTYTNTENALFGSFRLLDADPVLVSATATIVPYTSIIVSAAPTLRYNATGTGTTAAGTHIGFLSNPTIDNASSGTFAFVDYSSFRASPTISETAGTLTLTTLRGLSITAYSVSGSPAVTTHVGVDIDNLAQGTLTTALSLRSAGTAVEMRHAGPAAFGINAAPAAKVDIDGDLAMRAADLALANGNNDNIAIGARSFIRITGPTAGFAVRGIANGVNGKILILYNTTAQVMTINNNDAGSTAANRILTMTGAAVVTVATGNAMFIYDGTQSLWILIGLQA